MQWLKKVLSLFTADKNEINEEPTHTSTPIPTLPKGSISQGSVKWFSRKKKFGFIQLDEGGDIFVHISHVYKSGLKGLQQGEKVQIEIGTNEKGPFACNIKKLNPNSSLKSSPE